MHGGATAPLIEPWLRALLPWATLEQIAGAHWLLRKTGHVVEYAVLALLWRRALAGPGAPAPWRWPLALAVLTAALDEARQAITPTREGRVADVLLDGGAAAGRPPGRRARARGAPPTGSRGSSSGRPPPAAPCCSRSIWPPPRRRAGSG